MSAQIQPPIQQPLGRLLVEKGVISEDQLRIALQEQNKNHQPLGRLLVGLGFLSVHQMAQQYDKQYWFFHKKLV